MVEVVVLPSLPVMAMMRHGQRLQNASISEVRIAPFCAALRSLNQSEVAFVDEVVERKTLVLVLLCHADHEAQVGLREAFEGLLVALVNALRQLYLFVCGNKLFSSDFN